MINTERVGGITIIWLNHGKVNALDVELLDALSRELDTLRATDVGAIVLASSTHVFSAGVDLARVINEPSSYTDNLVRAITTTVTTLFTYPTPTVAAINGAAIAGGCVLACACDYRIIANQAQIGTTELPVGVPFPSAALAVVEYATGSQAEKVVFTGTTYPGTEAISIGLADEVADPESVVRRAIVKAEELARIPGDTYALTKRQMRAPVAEKIVAQKGVDSDVAKLWSTEATRIRLVRYLEDLKSRRNLD
jgi:enoyl-CoA hydratase/carnithine racemase